MVQLPEQRYTLLQERASQQLIRGGRCQVRERDGHGLLVVERASDGQALLVERTRGRHVAQVGGHTTSDQTQLPYAHSHISLKNSHLFAS